VTLSGGGYRAAAVHAGILWTLDQAGYPVDVLSTVSGGSIVGASYAMGMSAADFRDHLKNAKPGLPNDLMNFYPVFAQLFVPGYGSGDTYANHFDRVFFQRRTLEQTGPPLLIVNTTRYRDGTRRAFRAETDGQLLLGRVVAASGAFPVAFDPVPIEGEFYIDGGVVENLGIAGLQNHLESHATDASLGDLIPQVLIISDAGLIPEAPPAWTKPSVLQMASRAPHSGLARDSRNPICRNCAARPASVAGRCCSATRRQSRTNWRSRKPFRRSAPGPLATALYVDREIQGCGPACRSGPARVGFRGLHTGTR
jgi:predicted acylesterase/phospholipase RssA